MKCILVDDEPHARALLRNLILEVSPDLHIAAEASDVDSAIEVIQFEKPDIVFLDIRIKQRLGFEVLDAFQNPNFKVVFTTAYDQYALDAFEYAAVHYVLKPYDKKTLEKAISRCIETSNSASVSSKALKEHLAEDSQHMLNVPNRTGTARYPTKEILYLIGAGSYTEIYLTGGRTVLASKAIGHFQEVIADENLLRCHKKYIVNMAHVVGYEKGSNAHLILTDGRKLEVSRTYKSTISKQLTDV